MIWDVHAHLNNPRLAGDLEAVLARARSAGVERIINIGFDENSSAESLALAEQYDFIYAAVGVHPHDATGAGPAVWDALRRMARQPRVVAWGEIGLDYFRDLSPRLLQRRVFIEQIELADEAGLPIIIHDRDAHGDVLEIVRAHTPAHGGVFHSYSGSWETARAALALGFYLSFSGPVTYRNARQILETVAKAPADRILVETDCPYLPPEPHRGQRNEPAYAALTAAKIAELRAVSLEEIAKITTENAERIFPRVSREEDRRAGTD
ncbi:MAG: TatD family hydrolase [Gracilibacteraceae bacterium]|jgi:TatD DNase family protein|nr:TatD family hydrolase [Gracilibacteraceae bacterium]